MAERNRREWTDEEDALLKTEKLKDESWKSFGKRVMPYRSTVSISKRASALKIKSEAKPGTKYTYNKGAWGEQTPESCYWAGFFAADGCIIKDNRRNSSYSISLCLQVKDSEHLAKFANFCGYTGPMKARSAKSFNGSTSSYSESMEIRINVDEKYLLDLNDNFNITQRKTFTLQPPNISDEYLIDCFIIGFLDGDGCIHLSKEKNRISMSVVCASENFLLWVLNRLETLSKNSYIRNRGPKIIAKHPRYYRFSFDGFSSVALIDYFKTFPVPMLNRKWSGDEITNFVKEKSSLRPDLLLNKHPHYIRNIAGVNSIDE